MYDMHIIDFLDINTYALLTFSSERTSLHIQLLHEQEQQMGTNSLRRAVTCAVIQTHSLTTGVKILQLQQFLIF